MFIVGKAFLFLSPTASPGVTDSQFAITPPPPPVVASSLSQLTVGLVRNL